ncbi:MAG: protein kinase [Alphaproteobacteria bacterium]|nr:protein kinase [Alphaproteobacteria bacterium]
MDAGTVLGGRFEVVGELGRGGTATVWLAHDRVRHEDVALKVVHPHLADQPTVAGRLRREVQAAARVRHEAALVAHELHEVDGQLLLCLPLHRGRSLAEHVAAHGPWTGDALVRMAVRLSDALAAAHRAGVIHRDVSPGNVLVDDDGTAVLTDFGLARVDGRHTATATSILGTPGYLAPEVYEGQRADPRVDLYGLGAVLYLAATGTPPFGTGAPAGVLRRQLDGDRTPLASARPDLPEAFTHTVDALLAADPAARPSTAREAADLFAGRLAATPPAPTRRAAAAAGPPTRHASPEVPAGAERRSHLHPGTFRVVVRERHEDQFRRDQVRRRVRRRRGGHDMAAAITEAVQRTSRRYLNPMMRRFFGVDPRSTPEQQLTDAVGRLVGLPRGALQVPAALLERRFYLVDGVSEQVAETLALEAEQVGFRAHVTDAGRPSRRGMPPAAFLWGFVFPAVLALVTPIPDFVAPLMLVIGAFVWVTSRLATAAGPRRHDRTVVAFGDDLRFHLADDHRHLLGAPDRLHLPGTGPQLAAVRAPAPSPAPSADTAPPPAAPAPEPSLLDQVLDRVALLAADVDASTDLPDAVRRDLNRSIVDLRREAERHHARLTTLDTELARARSCEAIESAVASVQARVRRLETLQRGGSAVDDAELTGLQGTLRAHLAELDAVEDLERARVETVARLLELGAVAAEVRRDLFDVTVASQPLGDVVAQLRREVEAARQTQAELDGVDASQRARQAAAAQARHASRAAR